MIVQQSDFKLRCPRCSNWMIKHGYYTSSKGRFHVHKCNFCGKTKVGEKA